MTANRRIFLNIIATYGRSLYALVIGLLCGRWALMALGEVDYGLMGVVGGLTAFIAFFNNILSGSISRFYAFSVGAAQKAGNEVEGLLECRRWFTVAVSVHTIIPVVLMIAGYPLGIWAIKNFLVIPIDRVNDCIWVFRFVCVMCFLTMVSVPFTAMYTAKQYIAELTIYQFVTSTLNVLFLYYMIHHPRVWLSTYALWTCLLSVVPSLIISIRGCSLFPECRILAKHLYCLQDVCQLLAYAGWNLLGAAGLLCKGSGITILVNKLLGPSYNASVAIANTVAGHTQTLAGAMVGAFVPAITSACGSGDRKRMISLINKTCKFGAMLVLPLAIPLVLEVEEVMILWLKNPPDCVAILCAWIVFVLLLENMTAGFWAAISANGRIAWYQVLLGLSYVLTLPVTWVFMKIGCGVVSVAYALCISSVMVVIVRIASVWLLVKLSPLYWISRVLLPVLIISIITTMVGRLPSLWLAPSFLRVCLTTGVVELLMLPLLYFFMLDVEERGILQGKLKCAYNKVTRHI